VIQWTGETFFKENKTELSAEFREFEKDVDIRKNGIERYASVKRWTAISGLTN
jgi:endophilin-A